MYERSFDEMIAYFNRRVSEMDIAQDYKMELLGMVTALGFKHEKSSQHEQRWIPTSERLPDELSEVNVTWKNTEPEPYYDFVKGHCFTGTAVYFRGRWYWYSAVCVDYLGEYGFSPNDEMDDAIKVLAWMPLPEPYKESKNG